jgi:hypothetical protein
MNSTRIVLTLIWFGLAAYLIIWPPDSKLGPYAGWLALLFAIYNLIRWWMANPASLPPPPPHRRRRAHDLPPTVSEYHPEFDFSKQNGPGREPLKP